MDILFESKPEDGIPLSEIKTGEVFINARHNLEKIKNGEYRCSYAVYMKVVKFSVEREYWSKARRIIPDIAYVNLRNGNFYLGKDLSTSKGARYIVLDTSILIKEERID